MNRKPTLRDDRFAGRQPPRSARPAVVIAIPVHNEADRISGCVLDLLAQSYRPAAVVCLLNNCTDGTESILTEVAAASPGLIHPVIRQLPPAQANAGHARRVAVDHAAMLARPDGIVITTDADTRIGPNWVADNVAAINAGADVVCGRAVIDPNEADCIPEHLHLDDALECRYAALLDAIADLLDPDPFDLSPRHTHESGASIAVRVSALTAVGGIPPVALGEDRAFLEALRRQDARIRHDPAISVIVSGRTEGRATGGMADTMRRRIQQQDTFVDDQLEPAADAYRRVDFRARLRAAWQAGDPVAELVSDLHLSHDSVAAALAHRYFGAAWAAVESASPIMRRRRVAFADLHRQIAEAEALHALALDRRVRGSTATPAALLAAAASP